LSRSFARIRVDSTLTNPFCIARERALDLPKGGESMSFKDLVLYLRARYAVEEGQTMAEYGVVLAVIAIGVVVALGLLSTSISGAIDSVRSNL
jgi:Flp pilus assembly pilin Flp